MRLPDESETGFEINIVPMIDVIFSILAFFIISTMFLTRSEGLPVNLPSAQTTEVKQNVQVNLTVEQDGDMFLNRKPIQLDELKGAVSALVKPNSNSLIIINADEKVEHGRVVQVMDRLRQVPGATMAIAATQEE